MRDARLAWDACRRLPFQETWAIVKSKGIEPIPAPRFVTNDVRLQTTPTWTTITAFATGPPE